MRGVVDDPDLARHGRRAPARVQQLSWALGSSLAGARRHPAGAAGRRSTSSLLTLLVINGYAAAMSAASRACPRTAVGAPAPRPGRSLRHRLRAPAGLLTKIQPVIPMISCSSSCSSCSSRPASAPADCCRRYVPTRAPACASPLVGWRRRRARRVRPVAARCSPARTCIIGGRSASSSAITLLSLVLLTGYGGQVSLCQLTFVGLGAFAMGKLAAAARWSGVVAAVVISAAVGALVALPDAATARPLPRAGDLRVRHRHGHGLLRAARFGDRRQHCRSPASSCRARRPERPGLLPRFCAVAVRRCAASGVLAVRRGRFGRQLAALNDSPAACATLGVNINITKLVVFAARAGLAGLGGALFGGLRGQVAPATSPRSAASSLLLLAARRRHQHRAPVPCSAP